MPSASSLSLEKNIKALFVGPKHSGKTVAACSFLTKGRGTRLRVLDGDGRIRGILGAPWLERDRIEYDFYPPRIAGNNKTFFERINQDLEAMLVEIQTNKSLYETYVCDSLTAFCRNLLLDAIPLTHTGERGQDKGRKIGTLNMAGPQDYGFESTGTDAYLAFLRSIPLNVIVTAHTVERYGKANPDDPYSESIVIGEKLSLRDKIAANSAIYFDHVFRFDRRIVQNQERFFVTFISDLACTSYPNMPLGTHDITGKNFYEFLLEKASGKGA